MKVITWNVNNRLGVVSQQVQVLGQHEPDVVALQDVNGNAVSRYIEAFLMLGLPHVLHTRERQHKDIPTGVLLASRFPLSLLTDVSDSVLWSQGHFTPDREKLRQHWTRRTLFALLDSPWGEIEVANVYITPANHFEKDANGGRKLYPYLKLELCAGVYRTLTILTHRPRLLCGDFNAPQHELELRILRELSAYDLHDVYRRLHGYGEQIGEGWSWCYRDRFKYRFDHLFASETLSPMQAQYLHSFRELRLSDHRPLEECLRRGAHMSKRYSSDIHVLVRSFNIPSRCPCRHEEECQSFYGAWVGLPFPILFFSERSDTEGL